jgi:hypothetical protein
VRVLVACEYSGVVREAFRALGHDAYSCDILPAADGSPYHFKTDIRNVFEMGHYWDLMIAHPPCTYLCNSGVWALETKHPEELRSEKAKDRWNSMIEAREFFMMLLTLPFAPRVCIENPIPHRFAKLPKYTQTIQPYQFGDDASKKTCLWLKNLPTLSVPMEEFWAKPRIVDGKPRWSNQTDSGQNRLGPSETRGLERAKTYPGIAKAFAEQWGSL